MSIWSQVFVCVFVRFLTVLKGAGAKREERQAAGFPKISGDQWWVFYMLTVSSTGQNDVKNSKFNSGILVI